MSRGENTYATIDWEHHPERSLFVQQLWGTGLSTRLIAKRCGIEWDMSVTKNAIVGHTHRDPLCPPRPSVIVPRAPDAPRTKRSHRRVAKQPRQECSPIPVILPRRPVAPPDPEPHPKVVREASQPIYRADGTGCRAIKQTGRHGMGIVICDGPLASIRDSFCADCKKQFYQHTRNQEGD